jgi:hypothetical protein
MPQVRVINDPTMLAARLSGAPRKGTLNWRSSNPVLESIGLKSRLTQSSKYLCATAQAFRFLSQNYWKISVLILRLTRSWNLGLRNTLPQRSPISGAASSRRSGELEVTV